MDRTSYLASDIRLKSKYYFSIFATGVILNTDNIRGVWELQGLSRYLTESNSSNTRGLCIGGSRGGHQNGTDLLALLFYFEI